MMHHGVQCRGHCHKDHLLAIFPCCNIRSRLLVELQAHTTEYMLGNYYGIPAGDVTTPFMAIKVGCTLSSGMP